MRRNTRSTRSLNRALSRVSEPEASLPAPITSRTPQPRSAHSSRSASRACSRSGSNSQHGSRRSSIVLQSASASIGGNADQPASGPSTLSLDSEILQRTSTSVKRKRRSQSTDIRSARTRRPDWHSDNEEDVDELMSDEEQLPVASNSNTQTSSASAAVQFDGAVDLTVQTSDPSTSVSHASPVSSSSLAKLLHPTNVEPSHPTKQDTSAAASSSKLPPPKPPQLTKLPGEPLADYTCPICFFPPTNATLTPCGHICCGSCLFTAVKTTMQRAALTINEANVASYRCPVCRAPIPGWDGRGGGVIGLKVRATFSL
ncbi:hypothetical protein BDQ12DRAFT_656678 [Crucibulum laeve]|uniref:RING-type domain-containing protein n=1 Tax=Crucibulum laeve TaxID=68775 RepID=A0A5C3LPL5_9AGAR|nr:hypothetical protein BDQ12DRAFT_656678 [Crucibulum laeve]